MEGFTMTEHTSTVAMLTERESGVNTWRLSRGSEETAVRSGKERTGRERESLALVGWPCRRGETP